MHCGATKYSTTSCPGGLAQYIYLMKVTLSFQMKESLANKWGNILMFGIIFGKKGIYAWKLIVGIFYPTKASGDSPTNVWEVPKKEQFIIDKNMICAKEVWGQNGLEYWL